MNQTERRAASFPELLLRSNEKNAGEAISVWLLICSIEVFAV
jgi:hypothetical protein